MYPKNKCPLETTIGLISGKWRILIMKKLSQGGKRFNKIHYDIPQISAKVLTQQLKEMVDDGLVSRTIFAEVPPRVEYALTEMGISLFSVFVELRRWSLEDNLVHEPVCCGCRECVPVLQELHPSATG